MDWNERYNVAEYIYGTEPNSFLAEHVDKLTDPILSLSEGEGRNAVFLAGKGFHVHGVDGSAIGLAKATALAQSRGVDIQTEVADLATFEPLPNHYGAVVSISAHLPGAIRRRLYPLLVNALKSGGIFLLEAYAEAQLQRDTGGPKDPDMLMSIQKIKNELPNLKPLWLCELDREVREGINHTGIASVVQFIGRKE